MLHGALVVGAHPGRDPVGLQVVRAQGLREPGETLEGRVRLDAERCHGHQPAQSQVRQPGDQVRQSGDVPWRRASSAGVGDGVEVDLHQHIEDPSGALGAAVQRCGQTRSVERVDDIGVLGDRGGLVALGLADEVDPRHPLPVSRA